MNVAPIHPGCYRLRLSLWGFQWNKGSVDPAASSQAAVLRAHAEGQQQEGGRLLGTFTAASLAPREHEITCWLDAHESLVLDPVSIPWRGLQVRQIGGRTAKHVGPGVALGWFEVEGPINESWPPESHRRLFGDLPIEEWRPDATAIPPAAPDCCAVASRIAYWLWNSPPDAPLLAAAGDGSLARAFTAHMIRYATGADITYADRRVIEDILDTAAPTQYGLRSILHAIAAWLESPHAKAMP